MAVLRGKDPAADPRVVWAGSGGSTLCCRTAVGAVDSSPERSLQRLLDSRKGAKGFGDGGFMCTANAGAVRPDLPAATSMATSTRESRAPARCVAGALLRAALTGRNGEWAGFPGFAPRAGGAGLTGRNRRGVNQPCASGPPRNGVEVLNITAKKRARRAVDVNPPVTVRARPASAAPGSHQGRYRPIDIDRTPGMIGSR
jgi:hypothetical protein